MPNSVLILGSPDTPTIAEALAERGFEAIAPVSGEVSKALQSTQYQAIIIGSQLQKPSAQVVADLLKSGHTKGSPLIVSLGTRDATQRDQCLINGAYDVSQDGQPDDIAGRVDAAVHGWLRATPRRELKATFRAQRGRTFIDLKVANIDPTGFAIAPVEGLAEGALLRVSVALPDGELLAWGRLASADGAPGVRLIAMLPDERARIVNAIRGKAPGRTTSEAMAPVPPTEEVTDPSLAPVSPAAPAPPAPPAGEPEPPRAPASAAAASRPSVAPVAAIAPPSIVPPMPAPPSIPAAAPKSVSNAAQRPAVPRPVPIVSAPPSLSAAPVIPPSLSAAPVIPPPAPVPAAGESSIADAIGDALGEPPPNVAAEFPEAAPEEASPEAETILWPGIIPGFDACAVMLQEAATQALVGEYENGPASHVVLAFARGLSPIEKRAFDAAPPPELPEQTLAIKCLVIRLQLFTLIDEATNVPTDGSATVLIDDDALARVAADVNAASSELQKVIDGFVATGQAQRIKEINTFRNAMTKSHSDLRTAVGRLRGEVAAARGNMALLDVHENVPGAAPAPVVRRAEPTPTQPPEKKLDKKLDFGGGLESTPQQRERRRITIYIAIMVVLIALGVTIRVIRPPPRQLTQAELAELMDVKNVVMAPRKHHAFVVVSPSWKPDQAHRASLDAMAQRYGLETFTVQNQNGEAVAAKVRGQKDLTVYAAGSK